MVWEPERVIINWLCLAGSFPHITKNMLLPLPVPVLAGESSCGVGLRTMAWVVAHDIPGCYMSE